MRGIELGLADLRRGFRVEPAGRHEIQCFGQAIGQRPVALALRGVGDEILVPGVDAVQIGVAALGERAQQVKGGRRLAVGLHHALRIGLARTLVEFEAVDDVAAVRRQGSAVLRLGIRGARFGELASKPAELDHRAAGAKGQHHRHLQQHLEHVADIVRMEFRETFGAVAALQQKSFPGRDCGEPLL